MTYRYITKLNITLPGVGCIPHAVPFEVDFTVRDDILVSIDKITLTGKDGTRYRAHDWLREMVVGDVDLADELLAEAKASDEAEQQHKDAIGSALRA